MKSYEFLYDFRPLSSLVTKWYRIENNQRTEIQNSEKYILNPAYKRQLIITNLGSNDNGIYECEASMTTQGVTYPSISAQANVTVNGKTCMPRSN